MITISIENAAKELAKELKATTEFADLRQAQARIKLDPAAQDIMAEMEQIQVNIQEMLTDGLPVDEEFQKLYQLQHQAVANTTLSQYFSAQEAFSLIMKNADQIINQELE
ncbi:MAG TPA: YlbF family regulator [Oscillospiraceae bacterium]|nr:YlbF family regulator [Oscillospiraceae bacterium]